MRLADSLAGKDARRLARELTVAEFAARAAIAGKDASTLARELLDEEPLVRAVRRDRRT